MPARRFQILSAVSGIVGVIMLGISFSINNGPPIGATGTQIVHYGQQHTAGTLWGAWLQAIGPLLIVLFAFALVCLAGATTRLAGWMTMFGAVTLMAVSLIEIVYYMSALNTTPVGTDRAAMGVISIALIASVQHLYFIVAAPALFIPLGIVVLGSRVLPRALGYLAILFGAGYAIAGTVYLTDLTLPQPVQLAASIQVLWWLAAAITLIVRAQPTSEPVPQARATVR
jgi:hypothetical protein